MKGTEEATKPDVAGANPPETEASEIQPFLVVDERTSFKTAEDAQKAYHEAGQRISSLSQWEKTMKEYNIETPEELQQYLDEFIEMKSASKEPTKEVAPTPAEAAKPAAETLTDEEKRTLEWLEKKAGVVTRGSLDQRLKQIEDRLSTLDQSREQSNEQQLHARIEEGRLVVADLMKANELPVDNPKAVLHAERFLKAWLEDQSLNREGEIVRGSPLARFYSGSPAVMRQVVEEGFKEYLETINLYGNQKTANYQAKKENSLKKTTKPLPRGGTPAEGTEASKPFTTFKDAHNQAWDKLQQVLKGSGEEV